MKKKILFQSDFSLFKTGFSTNAKQVLTYLYNSGKYDLTHYCVGTSESDPSLYRTPWKSIGCVPDKKTNSSDDKLISYGDLRLNNVVLNEKPDVYIAVQDIWGVDFAIKKPWFNKINSVIWTTLDSFPLLPSAIEASSKVKNFWVWSDFATKEFHRIGHTHVKTVHGVVDCKNFFKLSKEEKQQLRKENDIEENDFVIGFVFRNQQRKTIPSLLQGFKKFKEYNPKTKLLLHTSFSEGWNIPSLIKEFQIENKDVLVSHVCSQCLRYTIKSFLRVGEKCLKCGNDKSLNTVNARYGVSEMQLNEIYNMMDVYCHPFTSGGQEIPIQEAKSCELITLVTNYSCGVESCCPEAYSLPLEWSEYREIQTNFIKAYTSVNSIFEQLKAVFNFTEEERSSFGKKAKEWVSKNFSIENTGKFIENFIDNECPVVDDSAFFEIEQKDSFVEIENIENDLEWVKTLFKKILKKNVDDQNENEPLIKPWMDKLKNGIMRKSIETHFKAFARSLNDNDDSSFSFLNLDKNKKNILYILPNEKSDIYLSTGFLKTIKQTYQNYNLYVAGTMNDSPFFIANDYVQRFIDKEKIETKEFFEKNKEEKFFDIIFAPHLVNEFDFLIENSE